MKLLKQIDQQLLKRAYISRFGKYLPIKLLIFMGDGPFWLIILGLSAILGIVAGEVSFVKLSLLILMGFFLAQPVFIPLKLYVN